MESVIGWKWPIPAATLQSVLKRPRSLSTLSIIPRKIRFNRERSHEDEKRGYDLPRACAVADSRW